ncbi:asparaginyl-tRNA synthetase [Violaceomyces palustris]|uniref:Asparaginyl-tRNA synthetase n=1 Tax=Violaceomyces palustris TaxID=1673888 RepID=A0ACD0NS89_9BASI|nr:asparaginyl-tRNA synthetase [Violaceomyces palustris]
MLRSAAANRWSTLASTSASSSTTASSSSSSSSSSASSTSLRIPTSVTLARPTLSPPPPPTTTPPSPLPQHAASRRHLTSTAALALPRQTLRSAPLRDSSSKPVPEQRQPEEPSSADPEVPWFLQVEEVQPPPTIPSSAPIATPQNDDLIRSPHFSYIPSEAFASLPDPVVFLQDYITAGPSSNLIARPPSHDEFDDGQTPISLIHPYSLSADPANDIYSPNDWILIVQVRSSAAGSVKKVALDLGKFLRHLEPPLSEADRLGEDKLEVDDLLGPSDSAKKRYDPTSSKKKSVPLPQRPKGMSRIEHELGRSLPDWAINKIALAKKFPEGWQPPKLLSREAQDGIRLLHGSDPEKFDVPTIAEQFKISRESVRRILKGGKWAAGGEVRGRQDRRARERLAEASVPERLKREEAEFDSIIKGQEESDQATSDLEEVEELDLEAMMEQGDGESFVQPVRFEGLTSFSSDPTSKKSHTKGPRKDSPASRGDGQWCLIDAGWCTVHVMTPQAREKYDIEGIWREIEAEKQVSSSLSPSRSAGGRVDQLDLSGPTSSIRRLSRPKGNAGRGRPFSTVAGYSMTMATTNDRRSISSSAVAKVHGARDLPPTLSQILSDESIMGSIVEDARSEGREVEINAWLRSVRKQKSMTFLEVTDGTLAGDRTLQAVIRNKPKAAQDVEANDRQHQLLTPGSAVRLSGLLKKGRGSKKGQEVELSVEEFQVTAPCDGATYPLSAQARLQYSSGPGSEAMTTQTLERREAHLRPRLPRHASILRTRQRLEDGMAKWFQDHDFVKVTTPVITSSDCEGAGEVFQIVSDSDVKSTLQDRISSFWSNSPAYLTVSSQLHLEAISLGLNRVWTYLPVFRAEGSSTNRHLSEFWMMEAEFCEDGLETLMDCAEGVIKSCIRQALGGEQVDLGASTLERLSKISQRETRWKRLTYTEAVEILQSDSHERGGSTPSAIPFEKPPKWGESLSSDHEKYLAQRFGGPVFVSRYPKALKPFYMRRDEGGKVEGRETVACFDLLVPKVGELVGGSLREEREEVLKADLANQSKLTERLAWYVEDLRRYGGSPHGGFGLGFERLVSWVTDTDSVRDVVNFPRVKGHVRF